MLFVGAGQEHAFERSIEGLPVVAPRHIHKLVLEDAAIAVTLHKVVIGLLHFGVRPACEILVKLFIACGRKGRILVKHLDCEPAQILEDVCTLEVIDLGKGACNQRCQLLLVRESRVKR